MKQNGHLKEAKKIFVYARQEYVQAKKLKNEMKARQAAEKGYLCLLKAVSALFLQKGIKASQLPRQERGRLYFLSKYGDKEIGKDYEALRHAFHIDAFHEGIINYKILDNRFNDLKSLIRKVEAEE